VQKTHGFIGLFVGFESRAIASFNPASATLKAACSTLLKFEERSFAVV
jgi:hypothetical protein